MNELVVHHAYNPDSKKSRMIIRETGKEPYSYHSLRLNGKDSIVFDETLSGELRFTQLLRLKVVNNPDGVDTHRFPMDLHLQPGQQVTLRFDRGRVLHTISHLPTDVNEAIKAVKRTKVRSVGR